jgi:Zn-dependent metalloprotease
VHAHHDPLHCFVPPYLADHMARSEDPEIREAALKIIATGAAARTRRTTLAGLARFAAIPSPARRKYRLVYDAERLEWPRPGKLVREEGQPPVEDTAVNEAYDNAGHAYDFYYEVFGRNSLDGNGMTLVSSVHFGANVGNAYWDGEYMLYGDGDGRRFGRMTQGVDVAGHELTHGVDQFLSNLIYRNESGALDESFADVFGVLVKQRLNNQTVENANWWLGGDVLAPAVKERGVRGIRTLTKDKAYENDPVFGTDPQPKHMRDKYTGTEDFGGVHINSGIPNHAFYLVATQLGGYAWEAAGAIWYRTFGALVPNSTFQYAAEMSYTIAGADYGIDSREQQAVGEAWHTVGVEVGAKVS